MVLQMLLADKHNNLLALAWEQNCLIGCPAFRQHLQHLQAAQL